MAAIGRLLVVAGPPASGKSSLIKRLFGDAALLPLELGEADDWQTARRKNLPELLRGAKGVILHHNPLGEWKRRERGRSVDETLFYEAVRNADEIVVLTLVVDARVMVERMQVRTARPYTSERGRKHGEVAMMWQRTYADAPFMAAQYDSWLTLVDSLKPGAHWLVDTTTPDIRAVPRSEWPQLRESLFRE